MERTYTIPGMVQLLTRLLASGLHFAMFKSVLVGVGTLIARFLASKTTSGTCQKATSGKATSGKAISGKATLMQVLLDSIFGKMGKVLDGKRDICFAIILSTLLALEKAGSIIAVLLFSIRVAGSGTL